MTVWKPGLWWACGRDMSVESARERTNILGARVPLVEQRLREVIRAHADGKLALLPVPARGRSASSVMLAQTVRGLCELGRTAAVRGSHGVGHRDLLHFRIAPTRVQYANSFTLIFFFPVRFRR